MFCSSSINPTLTPQLADLSPLAGLREFFSRAQVLALSALLLLSDVVDSHNVFRS